MCWFTRQSTNPRWAVCGCICLQCSQYRQHLCQSFWRKLFCKCDLSPATYIVVIIRGILCLCQLHLNCMFSLCFPIVTLFRRQLIKAHHCVNVCYCFFHLGEANSPGTKHAVSLWGTKLWRCSFNDNYDMNEEMNDHRS